MVMNNFYRILLAVSIIVSLFVASKFMYMLPIHVGSFLVTIVTVVVADISALLWVKGTVKLLPAKLMSFLHAVVGVGLLVSIVTGILMFLPLTDYLLSTAAFKVKMLFVLALVVNAVFIGRHIRIPTTTPFVEVSVLQKTKLFVSGIISTVGWVGAFVAAMMLGL